jgi:hypothetical protein
MEEFSLAARAPLEHHFHNHEFCGDWCRVKRGEVVSVGKYRIKEEEPELYSELKAILDKFTSVERLNDVHHVFETQVNESLNQSVSLLVPKNRTYSMTMALTSRVMICCGMHLLGRGSYWMQVCEALKLSIPDATLQYLTNEQKKAQERKKQRSLPEFKRHRSAAFKEKIKQYTEDNIKAKAAGQTYEKGKGFLIALEHDAQNLQHAQEQSKKQTPICPYCKKRDTKQQTAENAPSMDRKCPHHQPKFRQQQPKSHKNKTC